MGLALRLPAKLLWSAKVRLGTNSGLRRRLGRRGCAQIFPGLGQVWCEGRTDEVARLRAQTDPHSPGRYRVNGVVSNMPDFQKAFACTTAQPMVKGRVW